MGPFHTSLLREKFTITEVGDNLNDAAPVIALSNRLVVTFANDKGQERETFAIRTQNMHTCIRVAAAIAREIAERGPITYRASEFHWDHLWQDIIKGYEKDWNPDIWCALYMNGRLLYSYGSHHNFLDIIEQCDAHNKGDYADALPFAEKVFQQAGKLVKIDYDANVAMIVSTTEQEAKCGIILRGANRRTTFSFKALKRGERKSESLRVPTVLSVCAAFLEGVQLTFHIGILNYKYRMMMIEKYSNDWRHKERATTRLGNLNRAVLQFDKDFEVTYRPEQPDFQRYIKEAEAVAAKMFKPAEEEDAAETA